MRALSIFTVSNDVVHARHPVVTDLVEVQVAGVSHYMFDIIAPPILISDIWEPLRDSGALSSIQMQTKFIVRIVVSPLADEVELRLAVMRYIYEYYTGTRVDQEQDEQERAAFLKFFSSPPKMVDDQRKDAENDSAN